MSQMICPRCGDKGRKVPAVTPRSLLDEGAKARLEGTDELRFCRRSDCAVVYFGDGAVEFTIAELSVPVFQKSAEPERVVCYCFKHTVADIEDEVRRTGRSKVPDAIGDKCKQGLDRCEEMNPQGSCCLGNVRQVVKAAQAGEPGTVGDGSAQPEAAGACSVESEAGGTGVACCSSAPNDDGGE